MARTKQNCITRNYKCSEGEPKNTATTPQCKQTIRNKWRAKKQKPKLQKDPSLLLLPFSCLLPPPLFHTQPLSSSAAASAQLGRTEAAGRPAIPPVADGTRSSPPLPSRGEEPRLTEKAYVVGGNHHSAPGCSRSVLQEGTEVHCGHSERRGIRGELQAWCLEVFVPE
uniref:Uncharacterized protein n=1 Tax=Leersia perrieri TaxID=77586 RepID=A0A0D9XJI9_9ORYZ